MGSKIVTIRKVPTLDWAVALWGGKPIPTKQEKYKPLTGYQGIMQEGDTEKILEELYIRNPDKSIVQEFEKKLGEFLKENTTEEMPYKMPVEVILAFDINKKRMFEVDVDNLCKTVLDAMKGIIFEDDSQVVRLLALKDTHPFDTNGLAIGVNKLDDQAKGWFNKVQLFYMDEKEQETDSEKEDAEESEVASADEGNKPVAKKTGLAERIRNFRAKKEFSFGDAAEWQKDERSEE